jgi:hypothetical protein
MIGGMFGGGFNRYCGDGSAATVVTMSAVSRRFQAHYGIRRGERHFALVEVCQNQPEARC